MNGASPDLDPLVSLGGDLDLDLHGNKRKLDPEERDGKRVRQKTGGPCSCSLIRSTLTQSCRSPRWFCGAFYVAFVDVGLHLHRFPNLTQMAARHGQPLRSLYHPQPVLALSNP